MTSQSIEGDVLSDLAAAASNRTVTKVLVKKRDVPTYSGLLIASSMLFVYALLLYICFGLMLIFPIAAVIGAKAGQGASQAMIVGTVWLLPLAGTFFAAAIAHGASTALSALRDIALNSYRA